MDPCQFAGCMWGPGTQTVTLNGGAVLRVCVEHRLRVQTPTSRLGWWETAFATRLTPDSDYLPRIGEALHGRQFKLVEVTRDG